MRNEFTMTFTIRPHKGPRMTDPMRLIFGEPYRHPRQIIHNGRKPR